ncbi:uncharacterized protein BDR25DRAFT_271175 [Lindgomyces ingoldianus]|uniref:Uncharacterized protein n=1 Tax=Lindgomyces ingoldianus TaxID=673940 RepID=A0ACB6QD73_9PLEO|nr:uncharacterized protein BDR25DRAFT_271175 [Lindgomyces ingoldianus]KAF2464929.1 hypothetical protein BDR25DRAFT_271175 [Lindgomyces ingoldianus]
MSYNPNPPHGNPAGAQDMASNFSAMLARSMQPPQAEGAIAEAASTPPPAAGYGGVYNAPPPSQYHAALGPASVPQSQAVLPVDLPPQAFLTSAMLLDLVDKKITVLLRDETEFIGILRSYDQYGNLVLTEVVQRWSAANPEWENDNTLRKWLIADVRQPGVQIVRGENVMIAGTVDLDREDDPRQCAFGPEKLVKELATAQKAAKKVEKEKQAKKLRKAGIEPGFDLQ